MYYPCLSMYPNEHFTLWNIGGQPTATPQCLTQVLRCHLSKYHLYLFLGKGKASKTDEFSEKFQTAVEPPPPSFPENHVADLL